MSDLVEFISFDEDAGSDRPGIVVLADAAMPTGTADEAFWAVIVEMAWEDEWMYGVEGWERWNDQYWSSEIADEWAAFLREHVDPPVWRWYVWFDDRYRDPDGTEGAQILELALPSTEGAFRAAAVVLH